MQHYRFGLPLTDVNARPVEIARAAVYCEYIRGFEDHRWGFGGPGDDGAFWNRAQVRFKWNCRSVVRQCCRLLLAGVHSFYMTQRKNCKNYSTSIYNEYFLLIHFQDINFIEYKQESILQNT